MNDQPDSLHDSREDAAASLLNLLGIKANRKLSPKEQAVQNDKRLQSCAAYELSNGLMVEITDRNALIEKFVQFKMLVRRGSMTIDELEDSLAIRFGVVEGAKNELDEMLNEDLDEIEIEE